MTEASTTRSPSMPANAQLRINHGHLIHAHFAGSNRVIDCVSAGADVLFPIGVGLGGRRFRTSLCARYFSKAGASKDVTHHPRALDHRFQIAVVGQKRGVDGGRRKGIGAVQADRATAFGAQFADMATEPMAVMQLAGVIIDQCDNEMQLNVRPIQIAAEVFRNPAPSAKGVAAIDTPVLRQRQKVTGQQIYRRHRAPIPKLSVSRVL